MADFSLEVAGSSLAQNRSTTGTGIAADLASNLERPSMSRRVRTQGYHNRNNVNHRVSRRARMSLTNASPEQAARAAKLSSRTLATLPTSARNEALDAIHDALSGARDSILAANAKDLDAAKKSAANGELSQSILKRLDLSRQGKFDDMLQGIRDVRGLEDPGRPSMLLSRSLTITFPHLLSERRAETPC